VPFWRQALAPVIDTSPRVSADWLPLRRAFSSAITARCTSGSWKRAPKMPSSRASLPVFLPM
jgi:hypothetical protein